MAYAWMIDADFERIDTGDPSSVGKTGSGDSKQPELEAELSIPGTGIPFLIVDGDGNIAFEGRYLSTIPGDTGDQEPLIDLALEDGYEIEFCRNGVWDTPKIPRMSWRVTGRYTDNESGYWGDDVEAATEDGAIRAARALMAEAGEAFPADVEIVDCDPIDEAIRAKDNASELFAMCRELREAFAARCNPAEVAQSSLLLRSQALLTKIADASPSPPPAS